MLLIVILTLKWLLFLAWTTARNCTAKKGYWPLYFFKPKEGKPGIEMRHFTKVTLAEQKRLELLKHTGIQLHCCRFLQAFIAGVSKGI